MKSGKTKRGWLSWRKIECAADERRRHFEPNQSSRAYRLIGGWTL